MSDSLQGIKDGAFTVTALCPECLLHYWDQPHLVGACASVGIERGKSTGLMLAEFFTSYHKKGHKE